VSARNTSPKSARRLKSAPAPADARPRPLQPQPELNGVCTHNLNILARHMVALIAAMKPHDGMTEASLYKNIIDWAWLELESVEEALLNQDSDLGRQVGTIRDRLQAADSVEDLLALLKLDQAGAGGGGQ